MDNTVTVLSMNVRGLFSSVKKRNDVFDWAKGKNTSIVCFHLIEYKVLYWSTSRPNDKVEMGKSYSCIMIFISITRNILLASRVV
jgi:hypothetical protein